VVGPKFVMSKHEVEADAAAVPGIVVAPATAKFIIGVPGRQYVKALFVFDLLVSMA